MQYRFDEFVVDTAQFALMRQGDPQHAEPQVIELILYLLKNRGRMVSRDELNREIWQGRVVSDSALSTRIKLARQVLGDDGRQQKYIRTVHKKGFAFNTDIEVGSDEQYATEQSPSSTFTQRPDQPNEPPTRPTLAVSRFVDQGGEPSTRVVAEGISDDIITTLSRIAKLEVLTLPSATTMDADFADNPRRQSIPRIDYRLEGSLLSEGEQLRISVRLVDGHSGRFIWAQRYDREYGSLFELQDDITREVVSALQVELTDGEQAVLASRGTENIEAWKLTFEGQAAVFEHRQSQVRQGLRMLQKAVALDESYVLAWSALAVAHWKESLNPGWSRSIEESLQQAIAASERSLQLEPLNANALAVHGLVLMSSRDFDKAQESAEQAIFHARSEAHPLALASLVLRSCGEIEQSLAQMHKAMRLCPLYPAWYPYSNAICYWMQRQYDTAREYIDEAIRIDPGLSLSYLVSAMISSERDQPQAAREAVARVLEIEPDFRLGVFSQGSPFRDQGVEERRKTALQNAGLPQ